MSDRKRDSTDLPRFDPDTSPLSPQNQKAARARRVTWDDRRDSYVDSDGCPTYDQYGQPLG